MAQTSAAISGVTINELHMDPQGPTQDYDGDGVGDLNDEYIELFNSSGSSVNLDGWSLWGSNASIHTFGAGDTIDAGGYFTVVDSNGSGGSIQNVGGKSVFSVSGMGLSDDDSIYLHDPGTNSFIVLAGSTITNTELNDDLAFFTAFIRPGATQAGSTETLVPTVNGEAHKRVVDGDDTWGSASPDPGVANCFAEGTMIATTYGDVAVENLAAGTRVCTVDGRSVPILWIGRQTIMKRFWGDRAAMVRIEAGALGDGPTTDLVVTPDHGMVMDGCVINASALVNEHSVHWVEKVDLPEVYTVYHVETPGHEVIFANGAASETYLDIPGRRSFDNYQEYARQFGDERPIRESRLPRISTARMLPLSVQLRMSL